MKRATYFLMFLTLVFSILLLTACNSETLDMEPIQLAVGYIPNVQFAPFYVAMEKGFFQEEGLEITLTYGYEVDGVSLVGADEYQFAIASGEQVLLAQDKDLPVIYVMNWYEKYPVGITVLKGANIEDLSDLRGVTIGTPALQGASYIGMKALMEVAGLSDSDVNIEVIGFTQAEMLSSKQVDAVVVYLANEPVLLKAQGYDIQNFAVSDYLSLIGNGLITNQKTIENDPELVRKMVRATFRGMVYASENPEETYNICEKYVENLSQDDSNLQFEVLEKSIQFWSITDNGESSLISWVNTEALLRELGMITKVVDVKNVFSNDFLP